MNEPAIGVDRAASVAYLVQREILQILSRQSRIASGGVALAPVAGVCGAIALTSTERDRKGTLGARSSMIAGLAATCLAGPSASGFPGWD
ncbi:hypothetical protein [Actinomadura nitritigenes]|uniref:hypothetical protein n=1 Tax=Actinomadura nitritigenes TaxID=134602 RepID=UPI003D89BE6C